MTIHAPVKYSGSFTRPAEPPTPKAVGDKFVFRSSHHSVAEMSGERVEIVEVHDKGFPFTVANAAGKRWQAVYIELYDA
jgi:hypothetical protein